MENGLGLLRISAGMLDGEPAAPGEDLLKATVIALQTVCEARQSCDSNSQRIPLLVELVASQHSTVF